VRRLGGSGGGRTTHHNTPPRTTSCNHPGNLEPTPCCPNMWECIPVHWGTPTYGDAFTYIGVPQYMVKHPICWGISVCGNSLPCTGAPHRAWASRHRNKPTGISLETSIRTPTTARQTVAQVSLDTLGPVDFELIPKWTPTNLIGLSHSLVLSNKLELCHHLMKPFVKA
jgi:hypothetical protein